MVKGFAAAEQQGTFTQMPAHRGLHKAQDACAGL